MVGTGTALQETTELVGRFLIDGELARGGVGVVYSAVDGATGQRVALKRLQPGATPRIEALFEREFYVLSSLKHPRIIEVYEYGRDSDGPYYTMELLVGSDLRDVAPLDVPTACRYLRDVASSLALLHARRLLHRDVSPRNVRTSADGRCKLIDFGALASFGSPEDIAGTPTAIAPEALFGQRLDQRADLFSLGTLAYWVLTGRHAYPARHIAELRAAWAERPAPPSAYAAGVSKELDELVLSLLSLDVLGRPTSAAHVIERLGVIGNLAKESEDKAASAYLVLATLVERHDELAKAKRRIVRARGGQGSSLYVDANVGVGKSRFVADVALAAQLSGTTVLSVDGERQAGSLSTVRVLVEQLFRLLPDLAERTLGPHAATLRAVWSDLPVDFVANGTESESPIRAMDAWLNLPSILEKCLVAIAREQPLLVAVDNVDRADLESVAFFLMLARATRGSRVLVVATAGVRATTALPIAIRALREASSAVRLRELTESGVQALVRSVFGDVPHVTRTATRLFGATRGNPAHCMALLRHWVQSGAVVYAGGAWVLPIDISGDALPGVEGLLLDRLLHCSDGARRMAEILSVLTEPAPFELCVALAEHTTDRQAVVSALDELVQAEIVTDGGLGFRIPQAPLRNAVLARLDDGERSARHRHVGEQLLSASSSFEAEFAAGLHFIHGDKAPRGAALIAKAARTSLNDRRDQGRSLAKHAPALEAALEVYRRESRTNLELLDLLVPLVLASDEISPGFARRYADETLERLYAALGMERRSKDEPPWDQEQLFAAFAVAPVLSPGEVRTDDTPDVVRLVEWLIRTTTTLIGVWSASIDHEAQERHASYLAPFAVFGPEHPAAAAYEYCGLVTTMTRDRMKESHRGWCEFLGRIDAISLPPSARRRFRIGAVYSLGVLECQLDDRTGLARMEQLEALGTHAAVIANQLRFLYHGFRGELELAEQYRERVESFAVRRGSAWQVETWSTCTLSAVYANSRDSTGNRRVAEQLERLKASSPSLELFHERALATQCVLTGEHRRAIGIYEATLARSAARDWVGWGAVRGGLAHAHNELGEYDVARQLCEETIRIGEDDRDFVALNLGVRLELCVALAGLGEFDAANALANELLERYGPNENPMTMGSLHAVSARIARFEGNAEAFEHHLAAMGRWFRPTKNPALIAQCDALANVATDSGKGGGWSSETGRTVHTAIGSRSLAQSLFASCRGADERKRRALQLIAERAGVREAWLFTRGPDAEPRLSLCHGSVADPEDLLGETGSFLSRYLTDSEETSYVDTASTSAPSLQAPRAGRYRHFPLTVNRGTEVLLVGAIAVRSDSINRPVSYDLLRDVATELYQTGDLGSG